MNDTHNLLIIDDFQLSALGTKALLAGYEMNFDIFTAFSVDDGLDVLRNTHIDIILCDVLMPDKDGFNALETIKENYPHIKFMFLTISDEKEAIYKAFAYGADGYQFKDVSKEELVTSLKVIISGKRYFNPKIINIIYDDLAIFSKGLINSQLTPVYSIIQNNLAKNNSRHNFDAKSYSVNNNNDIKALLTSREFEILELVGNNCSTKDIAEQLSISAFTVSTHRKNIYVKLGLETLTQLRNLAREINSSKNAG